MQSQESGIVPEEYRTEYVANRVDTFGRAFLGLSVECARCHDHKYDPVLQKEYYALFSFFNNMNEWGRVPYSGVPSPTVIVTDAKARAALAALRGRIRRAEADVDSTNSVYNAGYRRWLATASSGNAARKVSLADGL